MAREIKICPRCFKPSVFTFCFDYNEYYCLNCGPLALMEKCKAGTGGQHNSHLIKREKEKDVAAKKVLENIKGFLNPLN
jgi:hypothetical protein